MAIVGGMGLVRVLVQSNHGPPTGLDRPSRAMLVGREGSYSRPMHISTQFEVQNGWEILITPPSLPTAREPRPCVLVAQWEVPHLGQPPHRPWRPTNTFIMKHSYIQTC